MDRFLETKATVSALYPLNILLPGSFFMKEVWKNIPGYEGCYKVSDKGNVKSLDRLVAHSRKGMCQLKGRILKPALNSKGYRNVVLCKYGKLKTFTVSVLMAMAFLGHKPNGYKIIVDHKNNIKTDDRLKNFQLISTRENTSKDQKNKTSRFTGVNWCKTRNKWLTGIKINGKIRHLGRYDNEEEAAAAYQNALNELKNKS